MRPSRFFASLVVIPLCLACTSGCDGKDEEEPNPLVDASTGEAADTADAIARETNVDDSTPPTADSTIDSRAASDALTDATDGSPDAPDASTPCAPWVGATDGSAKVLSTYTLAKTTSLKLVDPLLTDADLATGATNGALADDPGIGSGLEYVGDCRFVMVTDRGPNIDHLGGTGKVDGKAFPLFPFTPSIVTVRAVAATSSLSVESTLPILDAAGATVTGLPNGAATSSGFYDAVFGSAAATIAIPFDDAAGGFALGARHVSGGLDTEDVRRLPSGDLVVVDEYGPSVAIVDGTTGRVKMRYLPSGLAIPAVPYPVKSILPGVLLQRRSNKGFEGLALSPDGKTAYAVLQTPMGDEKSAAYGRSLVDRIVALDLSAPLDAKVIGQYLVLHDTSASFGGEAKDQSKVYFNAATWLRPNHLLMLERVSGQMRLVDVDIGSATKLVDATPGAGTLDPEDVSGTTGKGYVALGLVPAMRTVVFDTADLPSGALYAPTAGSDVNPDKLEGLAVIDESTFAITNDDDFGIGTNPGEVTRIWIMRPKAPFVLH